MGDDAMIDHLWYYRAELDRVVDGDTYVLTIDTGFGSRHLMRVRLAGVDAPERFTDAGKAAMQWVVSWFALADGIMLDDPTAPTWPLLLHTVQHGTRHGMEQDRSFDRYIAQIWNLTGESLADAIVAAGHAMPWSRP